MFKVCCPAPASVEPSFKFPEPILEEDVTIENRERANQPTPLESCTHDFAAGSRLSCLDYLKGESQIGPSILMSIKKTPMPYPSMGANGQTSPRVLRLGASNTTTNNLQETPPESGPLTETGPDLALKPANTLTRFPSALILKEDPADEVNNAISEPKDVLNLVDDGVCFFGITQKVEQVVVEPEFQEKYLAISSGTEAAHLRESLAEVGVGFACRKARKPEFPNQDNIFFCRTPAFTLFGVADGHGTSGHWVSHWVAQFVLHLALSDIAEYGLKCLRDAQTMMRISNLAHEALERRAGQENFDVQLSGTTLCLCAVDNNTFEVYIGSVGDSGCVLSKASGEPPEFLSTNHKPDDIEERRRIVERGGDVSDGRVWLRGQQTPGLAMSRSIGDCVGHTVGVIHQPSIKYFTLEAPQDKNSRHLLLCGSDGIWDFMEPSDAVKLVRDSGPERVGEAATALAQEAQNRWLKDSNDSLTDDISIIALWI